MSENKQCLSGIIGITATDCGCYGDLDTTVTGSLSGLYLNNLIPLQLLKNATDCEENGLITLALAAIDQATNQVIADVSQCLNSRYRAVGTYFDGTFGTRQKRGLITDPCQWQGIRLCPTPKRGAQLCITQIGLLAKMTGTVDVHIFDGSGQLLHTVAVPTQAGTAGTVSVEIPLPAYTDDCDNDSSLCYYFLYNSDTMPTYHNKRDCGCGGRKKTAVCGEVRGIQCLSTDVLGSLGLDSSPHSTRTDTAYGIFLKANCRCTADGLLCTKDYAGSALGRAIAQAIYYAAGLSLIDHINNGGHYGLLQIEREQLPARYTDLNQRYQSALEAICAGVDVSQTDCFTCKTRVQHAYNRG